MYKVMRGYDGLLELASLNCDILVSGISGLAGLMPAHTAINNGNNIAIANKEPLVVAGNILINVQENNAKFYQLILNAIQYFNVLTIIFEKYKSYNFNSLRRAF